MCTTCGCGHQEMSHEEMHRLGIAHGHGKTVDITVEQDILSENNRIAGQNRNIWNTTGCWAIRAGTGTLPEPPWKAEDEPPSGRRRSRR